MALSSLLEACSQTRAKPCGFDASGSGSSALEVKEGSRERAARKEKRREAFIFSRPLRTGLTYAAPPGLKWC